MSATNKSLRIDLVSDVVCPWCIIGYKQLEQAIATTKIDVELHWHPFELNPYMSDDGENLRDHIMSKYGITAEVSAVNRARMTDLGRDLGFDFNFSDDMRTHNTFRAHQLLAWADDYDRQHDLKLALFAAHFSRRENINDPDILADVAASVGLDSKEALSVLAEKTYADQVRAEEDFWRHQGIQGVPAVVISQKHLLVGAQGKDDYVSVLNELVTQGSE